MGAAFLGALTLTSGTRSVSGFERESYPAGPTAADDPEVVDWRMLAGLDYRTGEATAELRAVAGKEVRIPGFIVPLEDYAERTSEFLLVPYVGACVHVPPPPPNQLVHVKMGEGRSIPVLWWEPIWIIGTFQIETTESLYGRAGFRLTGMRFEPYKG
jgi:hypothetical protein